jgi:tetratricopeptide (TPR) repeat protein
VEPTLRRALIACLLATSVMPALEARAQPKPSPQADDDDRQRARSLHEQGMTAYEAGRFEVAASAFQQAHALSPAPGLLFNLAQAHRARGPRSCPEALHAYRSYLRAAPDARNRAAVEERIAETEPCSVEEQQRRSAAADKAAPPAPAPVDAKPSPVPKEESAGVPWLAMGTGGVGVVAAAIGVALYTSAGSDYAELERTCKNGCAPSSWEAAAARERTGLVLIGIGSAVAVGSIIVWLASGARADTAPNQARSARHAPGVFGTW